MKNRVGAFGFFIFIGMQLELIGGPPPKQPVNTDKPVTISAFGNKMDDAERYLEQYGTICMSVPILAKLNSRDFAFDLNLGAKKYFEDAKTQVQAGAASYQQVIQSFSGSLQGQFDPTITAAYTAQLGNYFSAIGKRCRGMGRAGNAHAERDARRQNRGC